MIIPAMAGMIWDGYGYQRLFAAAAVFALFTAAVSSLTPRKGVFVRERSFRFATSADSPRPRYRLICVGSSRKKQKEDCVQTRMPPIIQNDQSDFLAVLLILLRSFLGREKSRFGRLTFGKNANRRSLIYKPFVIEMGIICLTP
jgi:hypothetical protein